jgi:prepilin-type N-terminal cleavage/methylation domain-containing protein
MHRSPRALTLIEILVVIAIIGILVAVIGLVGQHVKNSGKRDLTRSTMDTVMAAIDEYHAGAAVVAFVQPAGWPFPPNDPNMTNVAQPAPQASAQVPPYELSLNPFPNTTQDDYYLGGLPSFFEMPPATAPVVPANQSPQALLSIEGLSVMLQLPYASAAGPNPRLDVEAKDRIDKLLGRLPDGAKVNRHANTELYRPRWPVDVNKAFVEAIQIRDAWGHALRYRYYTYRNNGRPFLWSAGPDGQFAPDPNRVGDASVDPNGYGKDDIFSDRKD